MNELGKRVKNERKKKGLSTRDLAEYANISSATLNRIENNEGSASIDNVKAIAKSLNLSLDYLVFGKEPEAKLNQDEKELLEGYNKLSLKKQGALEDKLRDLLKQQEEEESRQEEIS